MAIQFARIEIVGRSSGGNACCKGAYNARMKVKDQQTGVIYNFSKKGDNVYHEILLPEYADKKFHSVSEFMNLIERSEKRKDSQLLKDIVLALPDDKELNLQDRIEIAHRLIEKRSWVKEGLGVQVDIHQPHDGEKNWHAHLLITTRRFTEDGLSLGAKAVDLNPEFKKAGNKAYIVPEDQQIHEDLKEIINDYFKELGLENRVDLISETPQEHIGPIRMRSVLNEAVIRNEERKFANIESLKTGADVIARVTKHASIFTEKDLMRALKCIPNQEKAASLVLEALNSDQIMPLYHKGGGESGFYTITEVRDEELKLVRLGGYIANQKNLMLTIGAELSTISKIISEDRSLNSQQCDALSHLLLASSGLRILKGRAGTGKSHVLGKLASIASYSRVNVIGLAPTHKAKQELERVGYKSCDTIKGFLFKLHNNRADLPKNSLIVIDEAGMVGNDDYSELLRVAAARSCNVILAGDERQLSSVGRGGIFEVFADKFGSYEMNDIRRQEVEWGREVALSFSNDDIRGGINILKSNNRLYSASTKIDSAEQLLNNWNDSSEDVRHRLIIAVKNTDVDTLNAGARELLKAKNILSGAEISITKDGKDFFFMKNDRIVFNQSNKELGLSNGDFGRLEEVSSTKFVVKLDNGVEVTFNPTEFSGFKHGYASTVYKAQGASIKDVYVLHDGFSTGKNSYVAMSRHIKDIHLYTNKLATKTENNLIRQLGFNAEVGSSINYFTREDLEAKQTIENKGILAKTYDKVSLKFKEQITSFVDKNKIDAGYYVFERSEVSKAEVEEILDLVHEYKSNTLETNQDHINENVLELEERAQVRGYNTRQVGSVRPLQNNITAKRLERADQIASTQSLVQNQRDITNISVSAKQRMTSKERFYASREYLQNKARTQKINYEQEDIKLRQEVSMSAERIARDLLGEPNKHLSNGTNLRFGSGGSFIVKITGEKRGTWYDFKEGKGGDLFDLVQEKQNCDFKEAANYLRGIVGISGSCGLKLVYDHESKDRYVDHYKQATSSSSIEDAKVKKAENLYSRAKVIEHNSTAYKYLANARGITCDLASDIKTADIFDKDLGKKLPAIIAFARDDSGNITGGQQLLLDRRTNNKATVSSPRKSFGKIAGSFVEISNSNGQSRHDNITIIAEGLETALSIKQAGIDAKIICALGISNIKNYMPKENERVIIAADNDGEASITSKITVEAGNVLRMRGAAVRIVKPSEIGDFNDLLQRDKAHGASEIKDIFGSVISSLKAKTLNEFFTANENINSNEPISTEIREDISYLKKYGVNEDEILDAFKSSYLEGLHCLKKTKEQAVNVEQIMQGRGERIITESRLWGSNISDSGLINELIAMPQSERINHLEKYRSEVLNNYLKTHLNNFDTTKVYAASLPEVFEAVEKEQKFLAELGSNIQDDVYKYKIENRNILRAVRAIHEKPELFIEVKTMAEQAISTGALHQAEVSYLFKNELSMSDVYKTVDTAFEKHHIQTNLASFKQDKGQAKSPQEFLRAALNEQGFLVGLDGNLKYSTFDSKLQTAIAKARNEQKEEVIDRLEKVIDLSINVGISTNDGAIRVLQSTPDIKSAYFSLDKALEVHEIQTNLNNFAAGKLEAKLPEELITIFTEEQKYLAELKDNIKYPGQHSKNLLNQVTEARLGQQDNIISVLRKTVDDSIETGFKDGSTIVEELKNTENLKATYVNLDRELENHRVQTNLNNFTRQKEQAKTVLEILQITAGKQKFLSSLHNTIKYPELQSQTLRDSISNAHKGQQDNIMQELHNVSVHITKHKITPEQDLFGQLKNSEDIHTTVKELTKLAAEHHGSFVNTNINRLIKHERLKMGDVIFDCPMKYLRHEIENPAHAYADIAVYKKSIPRLQEIMNKLELKKEHEHSMGGMSM